MITANPHEKGVKFSIKDNGEGIPLEKINDLFNKNANYTTYGTGGEKGTGLGLNLCYDFVLKRGGQLWVESKEHIGSTFILPSPTLYRSAKLFH